MKSGTYIVLEGPDGGGTTTHTELLCGHLAQRGVPIVQTHEPTDGPIGRCIRTELRGTNMSPDALQMLYSADRAWHMSTVVEPELKEGKVVVGERCDVSTYMYGEALGCDIPWLKDMNKKFIQPDLLLMLLPPFGVCQERLGIRERDILEGESLQKTIHQLYEQYVREHPASIVIDTSGEISEVAATIAQQVDAFLERRL